MLGQAELRIVAVGVRVQHHQRLDHPFVGCVHLGDVALQHGARDGEAAARQVVQEVIVQGRLAHRLAQRRERRLVLAHPLDQPRVLGAAEEFEPAELHRLEAACRAQVVAELREVDGEHGFEQRDLLDQQVLDGVQAVEQLGGAQRLVLVQPVAHRADFVQHLLEPQLVHLMADDEEQPVVVRRTRQLALQRQQLRHFEVRGVGQLGGGRGRFGHRVVGGKVDGRQRLR